MLSLILRGATIGSPPIEGWGGVDELTELLVLLGDVGFAVDVGKHACVVGEIASDVTAKVREARAGHGTVVVAGFANVWLSNGGEVAGEGKHAWGSFGDCVRG